MEDENKLEVMYFHGETADCSRFTLAGVIQDDKLTVGLALCAKNDAFIKAKGRMIATGRVLNVRDGIRGKREFSVQNIVESFAADFRNTEEVYDGKHQRMFRDVGASFCFSVKQELMEAFNL